MLSTDASGWVAVGGVAVGVVALAVALGAALRLRRVRRAYAHIAAAAESGALVGQLEAQAAELAQLRARVGQLGTGLEHVRGDLAEAVRHVAVVRYDAFGDLGGRLSFSAALLDDAGDGLVLSAINGRSETRAYAKGVQGGEADAALSPEEQQAIGFALRDTGVATSAPGGARPAR